jgi:hypothetical protein
MIYEKKSQKLVSLHTFYFRLLKHIFIAGAIIMISITMGAIGYHKLESLTWVNSFYNASMILTGMGPVNVLHNNTSKIFASLFAVYGGIVILAITGIILAPLAHRLLHIFNLSEED